MRTCLEKKLTLSGETETYQCELVSLREGIGILRYVIDRKYDVAGYTLAPGDVTLALFWEERPYTLYIWFRKIQGDRAFYFNIADSVVLRPEEFLWRDLAVDILVDRSGDVKVLDEHELPPDLPPALVGYIEDARDHVLSHFRDIIKEAEYLLTNHGGSKH
jgi:hypothetical protein